MHWCTNLIFQRSAQLSKLLLDWVSPFHKYLQRSISCVCNSTWTLLFLPPPWWSLQVLSATTVFTPLLVGLNMACFEMLQPPVVRKHIFEGRRNQETCGVLYGALVSEGTTDASDSALRWCLCFECSQDPLWQKLFQKPTKHSYIVLNIVWNRWTIIFRHVYLFCIFKQFYENYLNIVFMKYFAW